MLQKSNDSYRQSGAALLLMMLVVIVGAAATLLTTFSGDTRRLMQNAVTQDALASAKDALLGFAVSYPDTNGSAAMRLPCPDIDNSGSTLEGESHTGNCGAAGVSMMGRLPWRTLGIGALKDGAGECLWYVVSGEHKAVGGTSSPLMNADTNGYLQVYQSESATLVEGQLPEDRIVAIIIAAGPSLDGQARQAVSQPGQQCSDDFIRSDFLETDGTTGFSNAVLAGVVGTDQFVRPAGVVSNLNDRMLTISRKEIADAIYRRHDFETRMRELTEMLARCVAAYGRANPAGPTDQRLPWPAPMVLTDYRLDGLYDDMPGAVLSGRLSDVVDDSNSLTGNSITAIVSNCDPVTVPGWGPELFGFWQQWKDHFFYFVAESYSPNSPVPNSCLNCVSVNGSGQFAAAVVFANRRLSGSAQVRNAPPVDVDTKNSVSNYLESANSAAHPYVSGIASLESRQSDATFNDILYCIDVALNVSAC